MTSTVDLLAALCAHLTEFELPTITSIYAAASVSAPQVSVRLACHEPSVIARGLLAWAHTLTEVTAQAWRLPRGDSVHPSVRGLLPDGASVLLYGGLRASNRGLGADLAPNATTTIPLAALRHAATEVEASA